MREQHGQQDLPLGIEAHSLQPSIHTATISSSGGGNTPRRCRPVGRRPNTAAPAGRPRSYCGCGCCDDRGGRAAAELLLLLPLLSLAEENLLVYRAIREIAQEGSDKLLLAAAAASPPLVACDMRQRREK